MSHDSQASDDAPIAYSKTADSDRALLEEAVTIAHPASELYQFWRRQTNLAGVMENVVSIDDLGGNRFRWTVKAPAGKEVSWVAGFATVHCSNELRESNS